MSGVSINGNLRKWDLYKREVVALISQELLSPYKVATINGGGDGQILT